MNRIQPQRRQMLAGDMSNLVAVAQQLGFPRSMLSQSKQQGNNYIVNEETRALPAPPSAPGCRLAIAVEAASSTSESLSLPRTQALPRFPSESDLEQMRKRVSSQQPSGELMSKGKPREGSEQLEVASAGPNGGQSRESAIVTIDASNDGFTKEQLEEFNKRARVLMEQSEVDAGRLG